MYSGSFPPKIFGREGYNQVEYITNKQKTKSVGFWTSYLSSQAGT